jgi:hypothetical protein
MTSSAAQHFNISNGTAATLRPCMCAEGTVAPLDLVLCEALVIWVASVAANGRRPCLQALQGFSKQAERGVLVLIVDAAIFTTPAARPFRNAVKNAIRGCRALELQCRRDGALFQAYHAWMVLAGSCSSKYRVQHCHC